MKMNTAPYCFKDCSDCLDVDCPYKNINFETVYRPKRHIKLSDIKRTGQCLECNGVLFKKQKKYCSEQCRELYYQKNSANAFRRYQVQGVKICQWQGCTETKDLEVHHILPLTYGGALFDEKNVIVLCRKHHRKAHYRMYQAEIIWLREKLGVR